MLEDIRCRSYRTGEHDMYCRKTVVVNPSGLHAKPASSFVREAKRFTSQIVIANHDLPDKEPVNAKNIISILSLGIGPGCNIELAAEGPDEEAAVDFLVALIESGFGEEVIVPETETENQE